ASRVLEERRQLEKELEGLRRKLLGAPSGLTPTEREIGGVKVSTLSAEEMDVKALRELGDGIKSRMGSGIVFLGSKSGEKATCILMVTRDLSSQYPANELLKELLSLTGGKGGGQPTMAQAGMKASELQKAFDAIFDVVRRWQDR
ncbi:MAG: alanine--tRNA ligase, partial [Deltaproteobacteria bacterium]